MSSHDMAIVISAAIYTLIAARAAVVMRRQSSRRDNPGFVEFWLAALWPMTMVFVGVTIILMDAPTPGFVKASALPQAQRDGAA